MRTAPFITGLGLVLLVATMLFAAAQSKEKQPPPPPVPIDQWIAEPEQHLPGWSIHVESPILTFPLRLAVTLRAEASLQGGKLLGHDLHFFVKVADSTGKWLPDHRYNSIEKLPRSGRVTATERFFAKPGDYRIAFIIYDSVSGTHGVWHRSIHVPADEKLLPFPAASAIEFIDPDEPFKPGDSPQLPPLENRKPLRVDVILNLTERSELELNGNQDSLGDMSRSGRRFVQHVYPSWQLGMDRQDLTTESLLAIADVMDELKLNGCIRVSVVDAVRSKVMLDRRPLLDPAAIFEALKERRDTQKVDAHVLIARQQAGTFLHNFLQTMIGDNLGCNGAPPQIDRAIVLISDALVFPESSQLTPLAAPSVATPVTRFFFFRMTVHEFVRQFGFGRSYSAAMSPDDQVGRLLKELDVRRFDLSEPKDFEKALPKFLEALSQ